MRRWLAVAALAAAPLVFAVDDPNAPLANTKQQLQALKKDEAAQKAAATNSVRLDLPSLNAPAPAPDLPPPKRGEDDARGQPSDTRKDWLIEGVDRLDRRKSVDRGEARKGADERPLDPSAPDYFLRLYERQRVERDAKELKVTGPGMHELKAATTDPFAPFMKEWLANSPVRDALKEMRDRDENARDPAQTTPANSSTPDATASGPHGAEFQKVTANPFVQALGLSATEPARPVEMRSPNTASAPARSASANTIYDLPERPKVDVKQAVPPPPSDDKKYFPQLKKF